MNPKALYGAPSPHFAWYCTPLSTLLPPFYLSLLSRQCLSCGLSLTAPKAQDPTISFLTLFSHSSSLIMLFGLKASSHL